MNKREKRRGLGDERGGKLPIVNGQVSIVNEEGTQEGFLTDGRDHGLFKKATEEISFPGAMREKAVWSETILKKYLILRRWMTWWSFLMITTWVNIGFKCRRSNLK
jgi:hypothetical protein